MFLSYIFLINYETSINIHTYTNAYERVVFFSFIYINKYICRDWADYSEFDLGI